MQEDREDEYNAETGTSAAADAAGELDEFKRRMGLYI